MRYGDYTGRDESDQITYDRARWMVLEVLSTQRIREPQPEANAGCKQAALNLSLVVVTGLQQCS